MESRGEVSVPVSVGRAGFRVGEIGSARINGIENENDRGKEGRGRVTRRIPITNSFGPGTGERLESIRGV
jgi:hypothetical protein